jgi:hypothetical protein
VGEAADGDEDSEDGCCMMTVTGDVGPTPPLAARRSGETAAPSPARIERAIKRQGLS